MMKKNIPKLVITEYTQCNNMKSVISYLFHINIRWLWGGTAKELSHGLKKNSNVKNR